MAPKGSGRVIHCEGLPPGWECVEKQYLTGPRSGDKYIRFQSAKHRNVLSLKAAVKKQAEDDGEDPEEAMIKYEAMREQQKIEAAKKREEDGILKGEKRETCIEHFRGVHGQLNGATVAVFPGWRGESKMLENCGQLCATYYDEHGRVFKLLKDIEAFLGSRMMDGLDIPDIELARNSVTTDESGKVVNVARRDNIVEDFTGTLQKKKKRRRIQVVTAEDYQETQYLKVLKLANVSAADLQSKGAQDPEEIERAAVQVRDILVRRGFPESCELLYVTGSVNSRTTGKECLDRLSGVYFEHEESMNGRPCYQHVAAEKGASRLICSPVYMFWSTERNGWKIGRLDDSHAGWALCCDDKMRPTDLDDNSKWSLLMPLLGDLEAA